MPPPLHDWETFYVIVGSSAAALTGLQFVVVALLTEATYLAGGEDEMNAFGTPTVVHFCSVLLIAAICSTPHQSGFSLSVCLLIASVPAVIYQAVVIGRARKLTGYKPVFEDWLWHAALPMLSYIIVLVSAFFVRNAAQTALYPIAFAALMLLYIGIHNSWDTATYIAQMRKTRDKPREEPRQGPPASTLSS